MPTSYAICVTIADDMSDLRFREILDDVFRKEHLEWRLQQAV